VTTLSSRTARALIRFPAVQYFEPPSKAERPVTARAATATGRFNIVEHALAEMLNWSTAGDMVDIYRETDFIQRIPEGMISSGLIEAYLTQARKLRREWSRQNPISD
jgi:hypothetical protein